MYDAWRSFVVGILDGVIALLGVILFLQTGAEWLLALTAFGVLLAWNFVPVEHRQIKYIDRVEGAQNGVALFGCILPTALLFLLLVLFAR